MTPEDASAARPALPLYTDAHVCEQITPADIRPGDLVAGMYTDGSGYQPRMAEVEHVTSEPGQIVAINDAPWPLYPTARLLRALRDRHGELIYVYDLDEAQRTAESTLRAAGLYDRRTGEPTGRLAALGAGCGAPTVTEVAELWRTYAGGEYNGQQPTLPDFARWLTGGLGHLGRCTIETPA